MVEAFAVVVSQAGTVWLRVITFDGLSVAQPLEGDFSWMLVSRDFSFDKLDCSAGLDESRVNCRLFGGSDR